MYRPEGGHTGTERRAAGRQRGVPVADGRHEGDGAEGEERYMAAVYQFGNRLHSPLRAFLPRGRLQDIQQLPGYGRRIELHDEQLLRQTVRPDRHRR